ncbi:MAG TPA: redoxin domain-containing protein [Bryobacteraceae bacterium]|nr:redoxin domain-containing protein [Bryobacteraceae bacterium]
MRIKLKFLLLSFGIAASVLAAAAGGPTIYDFNLPDINGTMTSFSQFKGKVLVIVNVASDSRFTPQYAQLQALYDKYKAQGVVVLGFPSDDFGDEEKEPEAKIKAFCETNYHITFPLFSKVEVRGPDVTPLFHFLAKEASPSIKGEPHWNFTKFIVGRKGTLTARFEPNVAPDDPELILAIENALAGKEPSSPLQPSPKESPVPQQEDRSRE